MKSVYIKVKKVKDKIQVISVQDKPYDKLGKNEEQHTATYFNCTSSRHSSDVDSYGRCIVCGCK